MWPRGNIPCDGRERVTYGTQARCASPWHAHFRYSPDGLYGKRYVVIPQPTATIPRRCGRRRLVSPFRCPPTPSLAGSVTCSRAVTSSPRRREDHWHARRARPRRWRSQRRRGAAGDRRRWPRRARCLDDLQQPAGRRARPGAVQDRDTRSRRSRDRDLLPARHFQGPGDVEQGRTGDAQRDRRHRGLQVLAARRVRPARDPASGLQHAVGQPGTGRIRPGTAVRQERLHPDGQDGGGRTGVHGVQPGAEDQGTADRGQRRAPYDQAAAAHRLPERGLLRPPGVRHQGRL